MPPQKCPPANIEMGKGVGMGTIYPIQKLKSISLHIFYKWVAGSLHLAIIMTL